MGSVRSRVSAGLGLRRRCCLRQPRYGLKFGCEVAEDGESVVGFEILVGDAVPKEKWDDLGLPSSALKTRSAGHGQHRRAGVRWHDCRCVAKQKILSRRTAGGGCCRDLAPLKRTGSRSPRGRK
ncbi:DUF930 domain-containing protein [Mesorhizobium sp. 131-2-1]|uniref:DUF930 domain-containing protein n=1 Tax=Mesorhizobium sp. 131-2-1 TaxID=2744518 RepID=UPI00406C1DF5